MQITSAAQVAADTQTEIQCGVQYMCRFGSPFRDSLVLLERIGTSPNETDLAVGEQTPLAPRIEVSNAWRTLGHVTLCNLDDGRTLCRVEAVNLTNPSPARTAVLKIRLRDDNAVMPRTFCIRAPHKGIEIK